MNHNVSLTSFDSVLYVLEPLGENREQKLFLQLQDYYILGHTVKYYLSRKHVEFWDMSNFNSDAFLKNDINSNIFIQASPPSPNTVCVRHTERGDKYSLAFLL